jgi:hypothetical protein
MRIVLGIICVLFGGLGWVGQVISGINYPLAQRLGKIERGQANFKNGSYRRIIRKFFVKVGARSPRP